MIVGMTLILSRSQRKGHFSAFILTILVSMCFLAKIFRCLSRILHLDVSFIISRNSFQQRCGYRTFRPLGFEKKWIRILWEQNIVQNIHIILLKFSNKCKMAIKKILFLIYIRSDSSRIRIRKFVYRMRWKFVWIPNTALQLRQIVLTLFQIPLYLCIKPSYSQ